jgi:hypothetical protein
MTVALMVACIAAWAVYGSVRRNRFRLRSRADLLDVLSGVVERARETPPGAPDPEDVPMVPGVVMVAGPPPLVVAASAALPVRPKRVARRPRSMSPAAVAARRARANRRAGDGVPDGSLIVIPAHEDDPVVELAELAVPNPGDRADRGLAKGRVIARQRRRRRYHRAMVPVVASAVAAALAFLGLAVFHLASGSGHDSVAASAAAARAGTLTHARPGPPLSPSSRATAILSLQPLATSGSGAIVATQPNYHLGIAATGLCWVRVTDATSGLVVMEGVLQPGDHRDLTLSGPALVRLGNRMAAALTVDTVPVALDRSVPSPFDVAFTGKS